jgi:hypothetical protein
MTLICPKCNQPFTAKYDHFKRGIYNYATCGCNCTIDEIFDLECNQITLGQILNATIVPMTIGPVASN